MSKLNPITREEKILAGEDLKPITRMEMFLKKSAQSGGGGATSWEDLGSTFEEGTVLAECTPEFDGDAFYLTDIISLTIGKEYTVNWNGVPYKCIAQDASAFIPGAVVLGDFGAFANGEPAEGGEPFVIISIPVEVVPDYGGYGVAIMSLDGSDSITLSITGISETITPIPAKYMPAGCVLYSNGSILYKTNDTSNPENILIQDELRSLVASGAALYWFWHDEDGNINCFPVIRVVFAPEGGAVEVHYTTSDGVIGGTFLAPNTRDI